MDIIGWFVIFVLSMFVCVIYKKLNTMHKNEKEIVILIGMLIQQLALVSSVVKKEDKDETCNKTSA